MQYIALRHIILYKIYYLKSMSKNEFIITKEIELDYGHTLPNHYSFCSQLHGHRAKVIAGVTGKLNETEGDSSQGMIFDFKILKDVLKKYVHDVLDHGFAVWKDDTEDREFIEKRNEKVLVTDLPPTAEVLARWAYNQVKLNLPKEINLVYIDWYETPTSCARYSE